MNKLIEFTREFAIFAYFIMLCISVSSPKGGVWKAIAFFFAYITGAAFFFYWSYNLRWWPTGILGVVEYFFMLAFYLTTCTTIVVLFADAFKTSWKQFRFGKNVVNEQAIFASISGAVFIILIGMLVRKICFAIDISTLVAVPVVAGGTFCSLVVYTNKKMIHEIEK